MKKFFRDRKGSTIVEVVVSFAVFLLCIAMITVCMSLAGKMQNHADEQQEKLTRVEEALYQNSGASGGGGSRVWNFSGKRISFSVKVGTETVTVQESPGGETYSFERIRPGN